MEIHVCYKRDPKPKQTQQIIPLFHYISMKHASYTYRSRNQLIFSFHPYFPGKLMALYGSQHAQFPLSGIEAKDAIPNTTDPVIQQGQLQHRFHSFSFTFLKKPFSGQCHLAPNACLLFITIKQLRPLLGNWWIIYLYHARLILYGCESCNVS